MRPETQQALAAITRGNIRIGADNQSFQIALPGSRMITGVAEDLRRPQSPSILSPESFGLAVLHDQEKVTLQVDAHTQVVLEGHANGHTVYRVLVDGHERLGTMLNRPAAFGRDPHSPLSNLKTDSIRIPEGEDNTSLLLLPAPSPEGTSGYFVANLSNRPMGIESSFVEQFTEQQQRVRIPLEDMPTVRLPDGQRYEQVRTYPPVLSHAAVEGKYPEEPSEDRVFIKRQPTATFFLADGMGGHGHGDEAAQEAIKVISQYEDLNIPLHASSEEVAEGLRQAFFAAHKRVNQLPPALVDTHKGVEQHQPGTTMVVGRLVHGEGPTGTQLVLAWAGDSRAYIQYPDGRLKPLTTDDNLQQLYGRSHDAFVAVERVVEDIVEGVVKEKKVLKIEHYNPKLKEHQNLPVYSINEQQADEIDRILDEIEDPAQLPSDVLIAFYNMRNLVTNNLGGGSEAADVNPHVRIVDIPPGSRIWYTSDGIHDAVTQSYLARVFATATHLPPEQRSQYVLRKVNEWNEHHEKQRHKYDDKAVGYQEIPLAA